MLLGQYALTHCYAEDSNISSFVNGIRRECKKLSSGAKEPRLGNHTTLLPPFLASPGEMKPLTIALRMLGELYKATRNDGNTAQVSGIDFFRNPGNDVLMLRLSLPESYRIMVEACRQEVSKLESMQWVFPLHANTFNPHICIAEEERLYEKLRPYLETLPEGYGTYVQFYLPFPQVMVKTTERGIPCWRIVAP